RRRAPGPGEGHRRGAHRAGGARAGAGRRHPDALPEAGAARGADAQRGHRRDGAVRLAHGTVAAHGRARGAGRPGRRRAGPHRLDGARGIAPGEAPLPRPHHLGPAGRRIRLDPARPRRGREAAALLVRWGAVLAGVRPALGAPAPWAAVPTVVAWAAALAVARRHRRENERIQVGLEQVLDRVEHGEIKPEHALPGSRVTTFARIAEEFRKAFDTPPPGARPRS